ncbi:MAG: heme exporter protein CcmB [Gammaproteobacteria bacterium]
MRDFLHVLWAVARRECVLTVRAPTQWLHPVVFFTMVIVLFPLGISPNQAALSPIAVGVIWIAALLASMLGSERLFEADHQSGALEQMALSSVSLYWVALIKVFVHWLFAGLPLVLLAPLLSLFLFLPMNEVWVVVLSLLLGTPVLAFVNAIGAAITLSTRGGSVLLLLICLPLQIPIIIFATGAVKAFSEGLPYEGYLAVLAALLSLSVVLSPVAIAAALQVGVQNR